MSVDWAAARRALADCEDTQDMRACAVVVEYVAGSHDGRFSERLLRAALLLRREAGEAEAEIAARHLRIMCQLGRETR